MNDLRQPDDRTTIQLSQRLNDIAHQVTQAKTHITHEILISDGMVTGAGDGGSRSTDNTSTVERTILIRAQHFTDIAQINDDLDTIRNIIDSLTKTCRHAIRNRVPAPEQAKCYIDPGLDGYLTPLNEGGFFDPTCTNYSRSQRGGPCNTCRVRIDRYRQRMDKKPLAEDRPIEHDSVVDITDANVAHIRPIRGAA